MRAIACLGAWLLLSLSAAACTGGGGDGGGGSPAIAGLSLSPPTATLASGQQATFTAHVEFADGSTEDAALLEAHTVECSASAPDLTRIDVQTTAEGCSVTGKAPGLAAVVARLVDADAVEVAVASAAITVSGFVLQGDGDAPDFTSCTTPAGTGTPISLRLLAGKVSLDPSATPQPTPGAAITRWSSASGTTAGGTVITDASGLADLGGIPSESLVAFRVTHPVDGVTFVDTYEYVGVSPASTSTMGGPVFSLRTLPVPVRNAYAAILGVPVASLAGTMMAQGTVRDCAGERISDAIVRLNGVEPPRCSSSSALPCVAYGLDTSEDATDETGTFFVVGLPPGPATLQSRGWLSGGGAEETLGSQQIHAVADAFAYAELPAHNVNPSTLTHCQVLWSNLGTAADRFDVYVIDAPIEAWATGTVGYSSVPGSEVVAVFYDEYDFTTASATAQVSAFDGSFSVVTGSTDAGGTLSLDDAGSHTYSDGVSTGGAASFDGAWSDPDPNVPPDPGTGQVTIDYMGSTLTIGTTFVNYAVCYDGDG